MINNRKYFRIDQRSKIGLVKVCFLTGMGIAVDVAYSYPILLRSNRIFFKNPLKFLLSSLGQL